MRGLLTLLMVGGLLSFLNLHSPAQQPPGDAVQGGQGKKPRVDAYGDPLPDGAVARLGTVRFRHEGPIGFAAFLPDGKSVISVGDEGTIRVWEFPSGKEIRRMVAYAKKQPGPGEQSKEIDVIVNSAALSSDGQFIATSFSDDRKLPLGDKGDHMQSIRLHEVMTGKELKVLQSKSPEINQLRFSRDSKQLISMDCDGNGHVWDWMESKQLHSFKSIGATLERQRSEFLQSSPDDKTLMLPCVSNILQFVEQTSGKPIGPAIGHEFQLYSVNFTRSGEYLLTQNHGFMFHKWEVGSGKYLGTPNLPADSKVLAMSQDGHFAVAIDKDADQETLYDATSGKVIGKVRPGSYLFSPDGKALAVSTAKDRKFIGINADVRAVGSTARTIEFYETISGKHLRSIDLMSRTKNNEHYRFIAFGPDGKNILCHLSVHPHSVILLDTETGKERGSISVGNESTTGLFSPDGRTLALDCRDGTIKLFEAATLQFRRAFGTARPRIPKDYFGMWSRNSVISSERTLAISPDSRMLAYADIDKTVRIWDIVTGHELAAIKGHTGEVTSVSFAPDGKTLASSSSDTTVLIWDVWGAEGKK